MNKATMDKMEELVNKYFKKDGTETILDVGSRVIGAQMSFAQFFRDKSEYAVYEGTDLEDGNNVDFVCTQYEIPKPDDIYDFVISANTIEHTEMFWKWADELKRVLKPGGTLILSGPTRQPYHGYPRDNWRIQRQGYETLITKWLDMKLLDAFECGTGKDGCVLCNNDIVGFGIGKKKK